MKSALGAVMMMMMLIMAVMMITMNGSDAAVVGAKELAAKNNVTCVLVFGDSSVDPGNNNGLATSMKGNFKPYGVDFYAHRATGRFCDGRLATDFIADAVGFTKVIPGFLDPSLKVVDMVHGVSFASAASGYDEYTANISNVLPVTAQLKYLMHYKVKMNKLLGVKRTEEMLNYGIFIMSMGTNDFLQNYFLDPMRPNQYTIDQYQDFLVSRMVSYVQEMHRLGGRRLVVVGVPPLGCMPLVKTLQDQKTCVESYNKLSVSFNTKMTVKLNSIKRALGMKIGFVDTYGIVVNAMNNPRKFGFKETGKGCCGTGTVEYGDSCKDMEFCKNPAEYVFWDAVHPTERMYKIIADEAVDSVNKNIFT